MAHHLGERFFHLFRLSVDQLAARLIDEHLQAARSQTDVAQEAGRFAANALLDTPGNGLDQDARDDRPGFQYFFERLLFRYPRKINARFQAGQHDDRPAPGWVAGLAHVTRGIVYAGVEIMLFTVVLLLDGHDLVGDQLAVVGEWLSQGDLV